MNNEVQNAPPAWVIEILQSSPIEPRKIDLREIEPLKWQAEPISPADPISFNDYQAHLIRKIAKHLAIPAEYFTAAESLHQVDDRHKLANSLSHRSAHFDASP